ncbi:stage II sporulation protein M [Gordonia sp. X0973]|uniref:stage II sporulation protein M n=1 Tax=Gordonia sp. X0973 TaxID=2742602 RepID=UPI000F527290|nr:stage II sporulation protein M [Gordonia sp. X0973]QKT08874.1 stage II sporulation protein M [Gordonia sp. X0973]
MDLDAYLDAHRAEWNRLDALVRTRSLNGAESDELLNLYQRAATHLSVIRSTAPDAQTVEYLSTLVARARFRAAGARTFSWAVVATYLTRTLPGGLYRLRWWWGSIMIGSVLAMVVITVWCLNHPNTMRWLFARAGGTEYVDHAFAEYYSDHQAQYFAFQVWTNNFRLALLALAFGVFFFPVVWVLYSNVLSVAQVAAVMIDNGKGDMFFGLILPHGMLELTCLFVSSAVGLKLFWTWVSPGHRTRTAALAQEGRTAMSIGLGLVVLLLISGIIEAFVTPSPLPTWARVGIGAIVWLAFMAYALILGRKAYREGATGDLESAIDRGTEAPAAA